MSANITPIEVENEIRRARGRELCGITIANIVEIRKIFFDKNGREPIFCWYGLSGDPFHNGHSSIVLHLLTTGLCDFVIIAPVAEHAFADKASKMMPYQTRREFFERWVPTSGFSERILISDLDIGLLMAEEKKSYAVDIIQYLQTHVPGIQISWAFGTDTLFDAALRKSWKGGHLIFDMLTRVFHFNRPSPDGKYPGAEQFLGQSGLSTDNLEKINHTGVTVGEVSSTEIRSLYSDFVSNQDRIRLFVPPALVEVYRMVYSPH